MGLGTPSTSGCPIPWIPSTCSGLLTTLTSAVEGQMPPVRQNWGHLGATAGGGDPHGDRGPRGGWHLLQALAEADHSLLLLCSLDGAGPEAPDLADGITGGQVPLLAQVTGQQGACPAMAQHAVNCHSLGTGTRCVGGTARPPRHSLGDRRCPPWQCLHGTSRHLLSPAPLVFPGVPSWKCQPPETSHPPGVTTLPQACVPLRCHPPKVSFLKSCPSPTKVPSP